MMPCVKSWLHSYISALTSSTIGLLPDRKFCTPMRSCWEMERLLHLSELSVRYPNRVYNFPESQMKILVRISSRSIARSLRISLLGLALVAITVTGLAGQRVSAQDTAPADAPQETTTFHLPLIMNDHSPQMADRVGFGAGIDSIDAFPEVRSLNAGWYVDWQVRIQPKRPGGIEHMQMVRVHQDLTCPIGTTADRTLCPYKEPHSYTYWPDRATIEAAAKANPGVIWFIGNEMDRYDWPGGGSQDEILPTLYPVAYHDLYNIIKGADPTARVAIGGVIQMTPMRKQYLDIIWAKYQELYGVKMPVDVWNVHNFIGSEFCRDEKNASGQMERMCYGMGIPPGVDGLIGSYYGEDWRHTDHATFDQQIRAMRQWIKDNDDMNKPLYVTEYGVLYTTLCPQTDPKEKQKCINWYGDKYVDYEDPAVVHDFMLWTFDYFRTTKDCSLSGTDDCRLVQRWAWYSLQNDGWGFNPYGALFDTATRNITDAGRAVRDYTGALWQELQYED